MAMNALINPLPALGLRRWRWAEVWLADGCRLGRVLLGLALLLGVAMAQAALLYRCPGNLFTNDLDPQQARALRCEAVVPSG